MIQVIPAILAKTKEEFEEWVHKLEPHTDRVHLDIIDGKFADNKTIEGIKELAGIETKLAFDVHLMVQRPDVEAWSASKADRIILHAESEGDLLANFTLLEQQGKRRALAFNPETDPAKFNSYVPHVDFVQFMTVNPGFYGSPFIEEVIAKIELFSGQHPHVPIAVDGGITPETAPRVCTAGASILVAGSAIINSDDIPGALRALQQ